MDFCLDQSETPLRAYTLDVCSSEDQQRAFALQAVFIGIGGALGFIVDGIDWENTILARVFGSQIKVVYVFAVLVYLATTVCNLVSIKETPWRKKVSTSSKKTHKSGSSKLSSIGNCSSTQPANCSDVAATEESEGHVTNQSPASCHVTQHVLLTLCEDEESGEKAVQEQSLYPPGRPVSLLPRITISKGLYMSTSCPGGLHDYGVLDDDNSLTSLEKHDSTIEEESNLESASSDAECDDVSISLPALRIERPPPRRRSLLDFIRGKEFLSFSSRSRDRSSTSGGTTQRVLDNSDSSKQLIEDDGLRTTPSSDADVVITTKYDSNCDVTHVDDKQPCGACTSGGCCDETRHHEREKQRRAKKETRKRKPKETEEDHHVSLKQLWLSIATMPSQLKWLCFCQLLGFIGMETVLLWYTDLMGRVVYKGDPQAPINSTEFGLYNAGVKMGCWGLTIYSFAMIMFSVAMERMSLLSRFRIRRMYSSAFLLVAIAMLFMFVFANKYVILVLSWFVGVSFVIMLTVPYYLVGKYHEDKEYVNKSPGRSRRGFGLDCAILACQTYAGNVLSASISSPIIHLSGTCKAMLLLTGACHLVAFFGAYFFVTYPDKGDLCCHDGCIASAAGVEEKAESSEIEIG